MRSVVVLPAPLGPRNPVTVPGSQRNETSLTTARPPKRFVSRVASIMPSASGAGVRRDHGRRSMPGSTSVGGPDPALRAYAGRTMSTPRWQMLPGGLLEEPGAKRSARDWIVDVDDDAGRDGDRR